MRLPGFGRTDKESSDHEERKKHPGHQAVLRHLAQKEKDDPLIRPQVAAGIVFDLYIRILGADGGRVRIEDLIGALASIGGHLCLFGVMIQLKLKGMTPQQIGMIDVLGKDGHHYFFGDEPNRLLLESPTSILSLVLGAAKSHGAPVTLEMVHEVMKRTADRVGTEEFGRPEIPEPHRPVMSPFEWVKHSRDNMLDALYLYDVPPLVAPAVAGFALQRAIDEGRSVLDPMMAARLAIECAVPMAKVDPARFD
jgi:hypothetical protein